MNTTKITSIILCQILLLSVVAFAQDANPEDEPKFSPQEFISDIEKSMDKQNTEEINQKIDTLTNDEDTNKVLTYLKNNMKDHGVTAEVVTKRIISKKSEGREIDFTIREGAEIQDMSIADNNFKIEVDDKEFTIPLDTIPKAVTGIEVTETGVSYSLENDGKVEMTDPEYNLVEKNGELFIENYKGLDGETHDLEISFTQEGWVKFHEDGEIEISGGAVLYDPATETKIELKDKSGTPAFANFYKNGHIVRQSPDYSKNNILVTKEREGIIFDIQSTSNEGTFIISEDGASKESYSDFPPNLDKTHSFLIDPEGKFIFIAENENVKGFINGETDNGYKMFGSPNTPQGGVLLDKTLAFGGGDIYATPGNPGNIAQGGGSRGGGSDGGGGGGGLGGSLGTILPFALVGIGVLAAALMAGGGDKKTENKSTTTLEDQGATKYKNGDKWQGEEITYSGKKITTGKAAPTKKPTVQSTFD